jgi:hypothetical protein
LPECATVVANQKRTSSAIKEDGVWRHCVDSYFGARRRCCVTLRAI